MKRVCIAAAAVALILSSCGSKEHKSAETARTESHSKTCIYEGNLPGADVSGIEYRLVFQEAKGGSVTAYTLTTFYQDDDSGQDLTFSDSGTVATLIGIPGDSTALVYQLVSATPGHETICFLAESDSTLTLVNDDFTKAVSGLDYTLKKRR